MDIKSTCADDRKIKLQENVDYCIIEKLVLREKFSKSIATHSSKLKEVVHFQVNKLADILRERELQLYLQIDEAALSKNLIFDSELSELCANTPKKEISSNKCNCFDGINDAFIDEFCNVEDKITFVNNASDDLKKQLQSFGRIDIMSIPFVHDPVKFVDEAINVSMPKILDANIKNVDQTVKGMKKKSEKEKSIFSSNESLDSISSFEVVDTFGSLKDYGNYATLDTCAMDKQNSRENVPNSTSACIVKMSPVLNFKKKLQRLGVFKNTTETPINNKINNPFVAKNEFLCASEDPCTVLMNQIKALNAQNHFASQNSNYIDRSKNNGFSMEFLVHKRPSFIKTDAKYLMVKRESQQLYEKPDPSEVFQSSLNKFLKKNNLQEWL